MITEKQIEQKLKECVENFGGVCYKFVSPGNVGVPDRLCVLPYGVTFFIECKGPDGTLRGPQRRELLQLTRMGHHAFVIGSLEELAALLILMQKEIKDARVQGLSRLSEKGDS